MLKVYNNITMAVTTEQIYNFLIKIQSIAKIGLTYSKDPYALSNYQEINDLSTKFLEEFLSVKFDRPNYFQRDIYPTPNISVRTVIFDESKTKVLLVREVNSHTYSLPGGWADLYDSPSEAAKKECDQEAGADIDIVRLVGLVNHTPFKAETSVPGYVAVFEGRIKGKLHEHEYETDDVGFFDIDNLPPLSRKVEEKEVMRMILAARDNKEIFD